MNWTTTFAVVVIFTLSLLAIQVQPQILYDYGRKLRITPNVCQSSSPRFANLSGICMFNLECQEQAGTVIGACVDRFLFGACCHIPQSSNTKPPSEAISVPTSSIPVTAQTDKASSEDVVSRISEISSTAATASGSQPLPSRTPSPTSETIRTTTPRHREDFSTSSPSRTPSSTSALPSRPSPSEDYPTRFPVRHVPTVGGSPPTGRVPSYGVQDETLGSLHSSSNVVPNRERTTLPSTRDIVTLLPLTLETFSSVSDPFDDSSHGSHHLVHHSHGQSHDSVEHATLIVRSKPRPSSTRLQVKSSPSGSGNSNINKISLSNLLDSTEEPPKISTFMYVNDNAPDSVVKLKNKYSFYTTTTETPVEEKTVPFYNHEDLNSNTENIWSVVMQLGSQSGSPDIPAFDSEMSKLDDLSWASSTDHSLSDTSYGNTLPTVGGLMLDNNFLKLKTESSVSSHSTTASKVGDASFDSTTEQDRIDNDNNNGDFFKSTTSRPWASSTYYVHTFTYPNSTDKKEDTTSSDEDHDVGNDKLNSSTHQSSTVPSIGKISTWSGVTPDSSEENDTLSSQSSWNKRPVTASSNLLRSTTSKPRTTVKSTTVPSPTTIKRQTTTIVPRRTTLKTSTTTTTTTEKPETTTQTRVVTDKWKKPKPYTLPPHKRPTTTEPTTPRTEPTSRRTTTTKKPAKTKVPLKEKKPIVPSIILDEDLDTNLDDFVEQVVQGIAGSLDNLNLEDVILPANSGSSSDSSADPTVNPLQILSDPSFPPFPVVEKTPLTKPSVKTSLKANKDKQGSTTSTTTTTQKPLDWRKDCGVRTMPKSGRIVGGTASKFGKWPWQALVKEATWLGLFSKNKCGGVLIAPKYVLTAAHCQPGFLATLTVVLGDFDISSNSENKATSITKNVRRVIVHRDYNAQTFENDIALLELDSAVDFQSHIVPICMPHDDEEFVGRSAYVTGWGRLKYGGGVPQILHEVDVPVMKNEECQQMFHKSGHLKAIRDSFICAGYAEGFKDSCEGDSGGPLSIQRSTGQWVLAGTVSHGIKCAYPNLPGVYMRMSFYKAWIRRVTGIK